MAFINEEDVLRGPEVSKKTSQELEKEKKGLLYLLYFLMLFYLALHNLIIPLGINIYRQDHLLTGLHYWFLFQFTLWPFLLSQKAVPLVSISLVGSVLRPFLAIFLFDKAPKSWDVFSLFLSEGATLIFLFIWIKIYGPVFSIKSLVTGVLLGPLILFLTHYLEIHPHEKEAIALVKRGGISSAARVVITRGKKETKNTIEVFEQEIKDKSIYLEDYSFTIVNRSNKKIPLRFFKAHHSSSKTFWKFEQILFLAPQERREISLRQSEKSFVWQLVSKEIRGVGPVFIIPKKGEIIPEGTWELTERTIKPVIK